MLSKIKAWLASPGSFVKAAGAPRSRQQVSLSPASGTPLCRTPRHPSDWRGFLVGDGAMKFTRLGKTGLEVSHPFLDACPWRAGREAARSCSRRRSLFRKALGVRSTSSTRPLLMLTERARKLTAVDDHEMARRDRSCSPQSLQSHASRPEWMGLDVSSGDRPHCELGTDPFPTRSTADYETPIEETLEAPDDVVKARFIGAWSLLPALQKRFSPPTTGWSRSPRCK